MTQKWNDYTDFSLLQSAPPLPVSFTLHCFCPRFLSLHLQFNFSILFLLSFYPSIFFSTFTSSLLHFLNSKSIHPFPCTTLSSYLHVSSWVPLCLSLCWSVEGCALSGLCALAARPSTQQPLLLLNATGPLLLPLSDVRVSAQCRKISWLQMISLKLKQ